MTFPYSYPFPFFTEDTSTTTEVPGKYPVALAGRPLQLDLDIDRWRHTSIPLIRQQADQSPSPGEQTLNPQGLWRRAGESWHHGTGQTWADKPESDNARYESSKGIDPWTPYQLQLLNDTDQKLSSANSNLFECIAGSRFYYTDNQTCKFTTDITPGTPTYTTVTATAAAAITAICSDGFNVYIGQGASGIYKTDTGATAAASWATGTVNLVDYVKGRLLATNGAAIHVITGSGAIPAAFFTQPNSTFTWVGFAPGYTSIYAAGFSGDKSLIYRIGITTDATALTAPVIAGELPDGEIIYSIGGYLGFILLGTSKGARLCATDTNGNLIIGSIVPTTNPVRCFEGQDRFVWYGETNYDSTSTGLSRMDLTAFTEELATGAKKPAYASDLMVTGQGNIVNVVTFQNLRVFSVAGLGIYAQDTPLVASGSISSGKYCYGLPDTKTAIMLDVNTMPLDGSYSVSITVDDDATTVIGTNSTEDSMSDSFPIDYLVGECFEIALTLTSTPTLGPVVTRYTLKSSPAAIDGPAEYIIAPFFLHRRLDINGVEVFCDVAFELENIKALRRSQQRVVYQEASNSYDVFVNDYEWIPYAFTQATSGGFGQPNGTCVTQLRRIN